jgi:hypothetical protein
MSLDTSYHKIGLDHFLAHLSRFNIHDFPRQRKRLIKNTVEKRR